MSSSFVFHVFVLFFVFEKSSFFLDFVLENVDMCDSEF
jgi:hypothetical protein